MYVWGRKCCWEEQKQSNIRTNVLVSIRVMILLNRREGRRVGHPLAEVGDVTKSELLEH